MDYQTNENKNKNKTLKKKKMKRNKTKKTCLDALDQIVKENPSAYRTFHKSPHEFGWCTFTVF